MSSLVEIVEVGPRDGLQNEPQAIPVERKIALIDALSDVGFRRIEAASFVSPKWVPQMAGSAEVMAGIKREDRVMYTALTPNLHGFEDALTVGVDEVAIFASASETFSQKNINASIAESFTRFNGVVQAAIDAQVPVRGYVSCVTDCPYEGPVRPGAVAKVADQLLSIDCHEVSLGETLGRGTPEAVDAMLNTVVNVCGADKLAGHFHDTSGQALENIGIALSHGLRVFDASVAGLGGCPYAPGAAGNVNTRSVAAYLDAAGYSHGLNLDRLAKAEDIARALREGA